MCLKRYSHSLPNCLPKPRTELMLLCFRGKMTLFQGSRTFPKIGQKFSNFFLSYGFGFLRIVPKFGGD